MSSPPRGVALFFAAAGVNHFVMPRVYERIVPPGFGDPARAVQVSGAAEIVGGLGVLPPTTRRVAGVGLIALLVAVFPANVYMALRPEQAGAARIPRALLWARLPLQPLIMAWVWRATRR
jgi:uncharacterized membrane protein